MDFTNLKNFMDFMAAERTPSNAVSVFLNGKEVYRYAAGYADLKTEKKLTGDEHFNIYSCSKIATVTAGMQLLERGAFLLNEPLYEYIPEFKDMHIKTKDGDIIKAKNTITVGDLFTMTAGLTYSRKTDAFKKAGELTNGQFDTVTTMKCLASDPLVFEPGTHWKYSMCHDVLGALISIISGKKFRDYMKDNIFGPLGMEDTVYHPTEEMLPKFATQYKFITEDFLEDNSTSIVEAQIHGSAKDGVFKEHAINGNRLGPEFDSGGGGIATTVSDYMKLLTALANYGTGLNGERILSRYSVDLMRTNRLNETQLKDFNWTQLAGYGYGLGVRTLINPAVGDVNCSLGEFGWGGAAGATAIMDPKINLAVFYVQHTLNPREGYYQPRLKNVVYSCLD